MAAGYVTSVSVIHKLMYQSSIIGKGLYPHVQHCNRSKVLPLQIVINSQAKNLHISHRLRKADNKSQNTTSSAQSQNVSSAQSTGPQAKTPSPQTKVFSVLDKIKKSFSLPVKLNLPLKNFPNSSTKQVWNNLGNPPSSKTRFFEFFSLREFVSTPAPFMLYGISGLIPFSFVPIYMQMTSCYCPSLAHIQLVYGACILSFLGGVSWGFDLLKAKDATFRSLGYSISLPLIAWLGVLMHPNIAAFPLLILGVAAAGYVDTCFQSFPLWFKNLRFLLTSLVVLSLLSTFVFSFTKSKNNAKPDAQDISTN